MARPQEHKGNENGGGNGGYYNVESKLGIIGQDSPRDQHEEEKYEGRSGHRRPRHHYHRGPKDKQTSKLLVNSIKT